MKSIKLLTIREVFVERRVLFCQVCSFFVGLALVGALFLWIGPYSRVQAQATLPQGASLPHDLFIHLNKKVNPAVANISTSVLPKVSKQHPHQFHQDPFFDLFQPFFGPRGPNGPHGRMPQRPQQSLGSGFIIRKDGLIITNNHVIERADVINVSIADSKEVYTAKVIGRDQRTDTALIKITAQRNFPTVKLGDSDKVQVGEWVAAFGNPFGQTNSMSKGIISAIGRKIGELNRFPFLQTDASINPGNSGGPLVNLKGEVIGVNTAIHAKAQGIGFAIPINDIKAILPALEKEGGIRRGFLGVNLQDVTSEQAASIGLKNVKGGTIVINVITGSPASKAGLKPYDFITHCNDREISSTQGLVDLIAAAGVGQVVKLNILREGRVRIVKVKLGSHPDNKNLRKSLTHKANRGEKAPFNFGFSVMDYKKARKENFDLPVLKESHPVIIEVTPGSIAQQAGLYPGDIILDINRRPVYKARDVLKRLQKSNTNVLRILRREKVELLYLQRK